MLKEYNELYSMYVQNTANNEIHSTVATASHVFWEVKGSLISPGVFNSSRVYIKI
jgi:hypothetical protein